MHPRYRQKPTNKEVNRVFGNGVSIPFKREGGCRPDAWSQKKNCEEFQFPSSGKEHVSGDNGVHRFVQIMFFGNTDSRYETTKSV